MAVWLHPEERKGKTLGLLQYRQPASLGAASSTVGAALLPAGGEWMICQLTASTSDWTLGMMKLVMKSHSIKTADTGVAAGSDKMISIY